jgi:hypothetical protein
MRSVVLLLIAANLGVFGWLYFHHDDYRPASVSGTRQIAANVEPLHLLSERGTAQSAISQPRLDDDRRSTPQPGRETSQARDDTPAGQQTEMVGEAGAGLEPGQPPAAVLSPHAASELENDAEVPGVVPPLPEPEPIRICHSIGPFSDRQRLDAFLTELTSLGKAPVIRKSQIEQPSGYWVYLPSMPRSEARAVVGELAAKGVQDYFLGRENVISLGIFSDKRMAERRGREIADLGYRPRVEPRFQTQDVFWLDLEESGTDHIGDDQWQALLGAQDGIRRQPVACQ